MWTKIEIVFLIFNLLFSQYMCITDDIPSGYGMRFRLPFTEVDIQSVSNVKIIRDVAGQHVFLLHGDEFYKMILGREMKRITLVAKLEGDLKNSQLLGAEVISWGDYILLITALEEHLEVYQFTKKSIEDRTLSPGDESQLSLLMHPIQQITLHGQYKGVFLCKPPEDNIMLIVLVSFSKLYSRLTTYEWSDTYFDPVEEKTIAPIMSAKIIGSEKKYLVTSRLSRSQTKASVIVYSISSSLTQVQSMQLASKEVHPFTYQGINYMLSCSSGQKKCTSFKMSDGRFSVYKNKPSTELYFDYFTAGEHYLVGQRGAQVSVFVDTRMECYGTFKTDVENVTSIITHINEEGHDFILLNYIRPYSTLVRIVEIEYEKNEPTNYDDEELGDALDQHRHMFEETVLKLRKILLSRKFAFEEIKKSIDFLEGKRRDVQFRKPMHIASGKINTVKIVNSKLYTPQQILQKLSELSNGQRKTRFSRGFPEDTNETSSWDLKVKYLRVGNLIYDGDLIEGFNLSSDGSHLKITKPVLTKVLETKELLTAMVIESEKSRKVFTRSVAEPTTRIKKLRVNRINGVSWEEFYQELFIPSRDHSISGRLILQSDVVINDLRTSNLNGLPTDKIFNLVEKQNITSNIVISRFFVDDLTVDRLNGLDFARDIARIGVNNVIRSPVVALDVGITKKLILAENDHQARHIFGTNVLDFQQIYTGKVVIEGSLTVENLITNSEEHTRVLVDQKPVPNDLFSSYWMYSVPQTFKGSVSFNNCKISAPRLDTPYLNDYPVTDYLTDTDHPNEKPVLLIFLSAHINGDLIADPIFGSKLRQIDKHAVKIGDRMTVSGEKTFLNTLSFDHGQVSFLNDLPVSDLVSADEDICTFTGKKSFRSVHIQESALIGENLNVKLLNDIPLGSDPFERNYRFDTVVLTSLLIARNIDFNFLNGFSSEKIFSSIRNVNGDLALHKDLFVQGNVVFESNLQVKTINNIVWEDYLKTLVRRNESVVIEGTKIFDNNLTIANLDTPSINEILVDDLFKNVLLKSQIQIITGKYTFDTVKIKNLQVPYLNGFPTDQFIDTRSSEVIINSDLIVKKMIIHGSLYGEHDIELETLDQRIQAMILKPWRNLNILGNAYWPWGTDQQSIDLQYLIANAVRHNADQVITGNVRLKKPLISTMRTRHAFPADIDFDYIAQDCLFHNSSIDEVVTASKFFSKPVQFAEVQVLGRMDTKTINRVDIMEFDSSLYRLSKPSTIHGKLTFEVPSIFGNLHVLGAINYKPPENIFFANSDLNWPPVKLQTLEVEGDLQLHNVDEMNFDFLLKNRVRKSGPPQEIFGHLTFEQLTLEKDIYLQSINNIAIDNIVEKNSVNLQEITGSKTILGDLRLIGPAMVVRLNGQDVVERYQKTIFLNQDYNFDSLTADSVVFSKGIIGSVPIDKSGEEKQEEITRAEENIQQLTGILKEIKASITKAEEKALNTEVMNRKMLMYFDYDFSAIIEWRTSNSSIQEEFIFDNNRNQYCDREQTIVQWSKYHNRIYLSQVISNILTVEEYGVQVTAENNCKVGYSKGGSQITITEPHFTKRFVIDKLVQSIDIFYASGFYVLIHAIDIYAGNNEIRIFKIDNNFKTIQDWQLLTDGVGLVSKLFKLQTETILIVSTIIDNYPSVTIYELNGDSQIFEITQVIDGDFNLIELVQITPHSYHLFLSCVHCQRIVVFEYDSLSSSMEDCHMYHIYQTIKLKTRIDGFNLFKLLDGGLYMVLLPDKDVDFYHIYKYKYIQGWQQFTYGYLKNIQSAYPLLKNGQLTVDDNLLLLCNQQKCVLVKAFYQG